MMSCTVHSPTDSLAQPLCTVVYIVCNPAPRGSPFELSLGLRSKLPSPTPSPSPQSSCVCWFLVCWPWVASSRYQKLSDFQIIRHLDQQTPSFFQYTSDIFRLSDNQISRPTDPQTIRTFVKLLMCTDREQRGLGEQEGMGCIRKYLGAGREADPQVGCNCGLQQ